MTNLSVRLVALFVVSSSLYVFTSPANAERCGRNNFCFQGQSWCPLNNPNNSWRDFIRGTVSDAPPKTPSIFSVEFRFAKAIGDPKAMGNLERRACYGMNYAKPGDKNYGPGYSSHRMYNYGIGGDGPASAHYQGGMSGDPARYEITIEGVVLTFNDAGEVLDRKGRVVGVMQCWSRNECEKYN